jgi:hypothetical protein
MNESYAVLFAYEERLLKSMREYASGARLHEYFTPERANQTIQSIQDNRKKWKDINDKLPS